jgi:pectate lyase
MKKALQALAAVLVGMVTLLSGMSAFATSAVERLAVDALGGQGGTTIRVNNLNDSGPGSLRAAVGADGPRVIHFDTHGTIRLRSPLVIKNPYVTIDGSSAPGGGIALRNDPSNYRPSILIQTHDVVLRNFRVRPGPSDRQTDVLDGIRIHHGAQNVLLDHMSISWAVDENLEIGVGALNVTVQWSIISEGLDRSVHPEGGHSRGLLVRANSYNISIHHNLFVHNDYRNPQISNVGRVAVVNNVVYNYREKAISSSDVMGDLVELNIVGNYVRAGPESQKERRGVELHPVTGAGWRTYLLGNLTPQRASNSQPESDAISPEDIGWVVPAPAFQAASVETTSAEQAYTDVLAGAGATLPVRDAVDQRIVSDVIEATGHLIDHPNEVGGWPIL